jgi:hypothetical protein
MPDPEADGFYLLEHSLLRLDGDGPVHNSSCSAQLSKNRIARHSRIALFKLIASSTER